VASFHEKPQGEGGFINGGFFVLSPMVAGYLNGDATVWEQEPLQRLPPMASCTPSGMRASSSQWTPFGTIPTSNSSGPPAVRLGSAGDAGFWPAGASLSPAKLVSRALGWPFG